MKVILVVVVALAGCSSVPKMAQPDLSQWQQVNASVPPELADKGVTLPARWR